MLYHAVSLLDLWDPVGSVILCMYRSTAYNGILEYPRGIGQYSGILEYPRGVGQYSGILEYPRGIGQYSGILEYPRGIGQYNGILEYPRGIGQYNGMEDTNALPLHGMYSSQMVSVAW